MATGLQRHGRRCHGNWLLMSDGCGIGGNSIIGGGGGIGTGSGSFVVNIAVKCYFIECCLELVM